MAELTRKQYEEMSLDELIAWAQENVYDYTTREMLIDWAESRIKAGDLALAAHILEALVDTDGKAIKGGYFYDYGMGTMETPTPLTGKEDFECFVEDYDED